MNDKHKIILEAMINESSLSDIQKQLSKKKLEIGADLTIKDTSKAKTNIKKKLKEMGGIIKNWQALKDIIKSVYEVDAAMTNLYKITGETDTQYQKFLNNAGKNSKLLGRNIAEIINQTASWAKLGYNTEQASKLAKTSSIYANISGTDDEAAIADIDAAIKAFNISAEDSITILDKLNALSRQYSISSAQLGTGLSTSAAAMAQTGNNLDETIALLTALTETTKDASKSGDILNTLSLRIRGMKEALDTLGENSDEIGSVNEIQSRILNLTNKKVNILDNLAPDGFRSTYEILSGISREWENISKTDQTALLEIIAGKQNSSIVSTLITNMAQADNALNASLNSSGSAMAEQEKWMQSLEAKTKQFESAFQSLSTTVLNSNLIKTFIDLGTIGVQSIEKITKLLTPLGTLTAGIGGYLGSKNIGRVKCHPSERICRLSCMF